MKEARRTQPPKYISHGRRRASPAKRVLIAAAILSWLQGCDGPVPVELPPPGPTPPPVEEPTPGPSPAPAPEPTPEPAPEETTRLAPEGILYVVEPISLTTDEGIFKIIEGAEVEVLDQQGATLTVSYEGKEVTAAQHHCRQLHGHPG